MSSGVTLENGAITQHVSNSVWEQGGGYRCHVVIVKDDEGGFSAVVLNLPGAGSCGDTEEEALENAKEAILGVLEVHKASGKAIPWKDTSSEEVPAGAKHKWIILDA